MKQPFDIKTNCALTPLSLIYFLILLSLSSSCDKRNNPVPVARFSITIDLNLPDYNKDAFILNYDPYTRRVVGVSGVLIKRDLTGDGFNAFERYCPHDQKTSCKVKFDEDLSTATCPCCESQFLIASPDADVLDGPSVYPLKTYKTRLEGRRLTIYN